MHEEGSQNRRAGDLDNVVLLESVLEASNSGGTDASRNTQTGFLLRPQ
jgi:hypothetical protein